MKHEKNQYSRNISSSALMKHKSITNSTILLFNCIFNLNICPVKPTSLIFVHDSTPTVARRLHPSYLCSSDFMHTLLIPWKYKITP